MNFADHLMALEKKRGTISKQYRNFYHSSNISINSTSSFSDENDDSPIENVFSDRDRESSTSRLNGELATILAANRLLSAQERESSRPKKNVYVQKRVKHSSGDSTKGKSKKMATAWKRITDKFGKGDKRPKLSEFDDAWRRYSLDTVNREEDRRANLRKLLSLETEEERQRLHRPTRPRSNSMASHFKILSKHAETADFTVTEPSKLADASALCQEYFSRLTCYDAVPQFTSVIAVDKTIPVSSIFNIFCENNATDIILWDSAISSAVGTCHVDGLVCRLWAKARRSGIDRLLDVEGDFSLPLGKICSLPRMKSVPANTSLMDAAWFICKMKDDREARSSKRLALTNESTNDVVHLLSAWDMLHFFSQEVSKFHAAQTAFDRTLESILALQPESHRQIEVLAESKPLKEVISFLASNGGGAVVSHYEFVQGKQAVVSLSFLDIIRYVVDSHGSWNEADATNKTLGHVMRYYTKKDSLVFTASTPLFAVLQGWTPSMTADMPVVVVADNSAQTVLGVLEPEHLLQALLLDTAQTNGEVDQNVSNASNATEVPLYKYTRL